MIPPLLCDARVYEAQVTTLSRQQAVMVVPSACGERMEEIASQILTWAPAKFAVMGTGFGGMVAMEILRRASERVTRVALVATSAQADTPEQAAARETQIIAARAGRFADVLQDEIRADRLAPDSDRRTLLNGLQTMAKDFGPEAYVKQARALQRRKEQQATLRKTTQPALVICGGHEGADQQKRHAFMAELMPNAQLHVMDNAGYMPSIEAPALFTQALKDWMQ